MKKIATAALAALIGVSAIAATAGSASADPYWRHDRHHHRHHGGGDLAAGLAAGAILGLGIGALAASPGYDREVPPPRYARDYPPPRYARAAWRDHVDWCLDRYRSYDPRSDTFIGYDGYERRCISPYD
ncbi:BA14K family protein [Prosthecomicrobium pneumaticum]|uniref:Lectin-like protein BA14k n=1 Tax=Prosthecomicrobium pneumaticum TaxID=81895 RepID=A0A7W9FQI1_9HYPH|nr:BA14K family protein [Prosthecomicrobium pneumaticum]MBB5755007.1 hypothetical protein [Prosthecomicrobium pneumaticum]